jgi:membrane associated rhomboid family serine protease
MFIPLKDDNPTRRPALLTIALIAVNVIVFVYQAYFSRAYLDHPLTGADMNVYAWSSSLQYHVARDGMVPREIVTMRNTQIPLGEDAWGRTVLYARDGTPPLTLLTSLFMHGSLWHLLGNMLFLWIFGNNIEDQLGRVRFILFYLLCGVGSSLIHVAFHTDSQIPVIGASGAVSGVMGAYMLLFPRARVRTLVFIFVFITFIDVPAALFLVIWFLSQFALTPDSGIAWLAHVGGFALGMALLSVLSRKPQPPRVELLE